MNRLLCSSIERVGLLSRNVAKSQITTGIRAQSAVGPKIPGLSDFIYYPVVFAVVGGFTLARIYKYKLKEEDRLSRSDLNRK